MKKVQIKSIKKIQSNDKRYDLTVENTNNYYANDILIHNCNVSFSYDDNELWVKSRNYYLKEDESNLYWNVALNYDLKNKLDKFPHFAFFAELYGQVKGFRYDCQVINNKLTPKLRFFDVYDLRKMTYLPWNEAEKMILEAGLETVPVLYKGPWKSGVELDQPMWQYAEGKSFIGQNIREGFVVRPLTPRFDNRLGRVILKLKGQDYHLSKK